MKTSNRSHRSDALTTTYTFIDSDFKIDFKSMLCRPLNYVEMSHFRLVRSSLKN